MPDYQKMYYSVCSTIASVLDHMPEADIFTEVRKRLTNALLEAEEIYMETADAFQAPTPSQEGVIFAAFYPSAGDTPADPAPLPLLSEEEEETCVRFYKRRSDREPAMPSIGALKLAPRFIALAKELSEAYEVTMEIAAEKHGIVANIYLTESYYPRDFALKTAQLIDMCDYFTIWISRTHPGNVILAPVLYTKI